MNRSLANVALDKHTEFKSRLGTTLFQKFVHNFGQSAFKDAGPEESSRVIWMAMNLIGYEASTFAVADEIVDLLQAGAEQMPAYELRIEDLPMHNGYVWFESPLIVNDVKDKPFAVTAVGWCVVYSQDGPSAPAREPNGILIFCLSNPYDVRDSQHEIYGNDEELRLLPFNDQWPLFVSHWKFNEHVGEGQDFSLLSDRILAAFFRFIDEPFVDSRAVVPDRAVRRRAGRPAVPEAGVKVVQLRRAANNSQSPPRGEDDPYYTHRWIVRPHWRNQWYPSEQRHKPKFIHAYVKGPDGSPLIVRDQVFLVER